MSFVENYESDHCVTPVQMFAGCHFNLDFLLEKSLIIALSKMNEYSLFIVINFVSLASKG